MKDFKMQTQGSRTWFQFSYWILSLKYQSDIKLVDMHYYIFDCPKNNKTQISDWWSK